MTGESYLKEEDLHASVLNLLSDEDQLNKLIDSNNFQNRADFQSGMIFGMSILAMYASVHSNKIMITSERKGIYLSTIRDLYKDGQFAIAPDENKFDPDKHDGVIHYGCLCLRGKSLDKKLGDVIPWYDRTNCISSLINQGALKLNKDKHTVKVGKEYKGRFYAIKLEMLE